MVQQPIDPVACMESQAAGIQGSTESTEVNRSQRGLWWFGSMGLPQLVRIHPPAQSTAQLVGRLSHIFYFQPLKWDDGPQWRAYLRNILSHLSHPALFDILDLVSACHSLVFLDTTMIAGIPLRLSHLPVHYKKHPI